MNYYLLVASIINALIAIIHLLCIPFGAKMFRLLGAGEVIAQMAENGHWYPSVIAAIISIVFWVFVLIRYQVWV